MLPIFWIPAGDPELLKGEADFNDETCRYCDRCSCRAREPMPKIASKVYLPVRVFGFPLSSEERRTAEGERRRREAQAGAQTACAAPQEPCISIPTRLEDWLGFST